MNCFYCENELIDYMVHYPKFFSLDKSEEELIPPKNGKDAIGNSTDWNAIHKSQLIECVIDSNFNIGTKLVLIDKIYEFLK